jgi:tRNA-2-methylthio-N6-dimethylallyladenosine synthase
VTSYPRDFTPRMIERYAMHANLCDYLHLPVQSGSDAVLRRMGRGYAVADYLDLLERLRATRTSIAISTDLIVGFPGETDADFEATLELVESARFSALFAFRYSPRPGTAAPRLDGAVPERVAEERLQRLLARQNVIQAELNRALEGAEMEVLVTGWGREPGRLEGRTSCHRIVHFAPLGAASPGEILRVEIERGLPHSLVGRELPRVGREAGDRGRARLPVVA